MKIKALKTLVGEYGRLDRGDIVDLPSFIAGQLLALGYIERVAEMEHEGARRGKPKNGKSKD